MGLIYFIALRASAAVPPLICALDADLGAMGAGGRAVVYGATGHAAGARLRWGLPFGRLPAPKLFKIGF